jgi:hypothetical protein
MGVTRRRDGFRNNSDERSTWLWQFAAVSGDQTDREVQTKSAPGHPATMSFSAGYSEKWRFSAAKFLRRDSGFRCFFV